MSFSGNTFGGGNFDSNPNDYTNNDSNTNTYDDNNDSATYVSCYTEETNVAYSPDPYPDPNPMSTVTDTAYVPIVEVSDPTSHGDTHHPGHHHAKHNEDSNPNHHHSHHAPNSSPLPLPLPENPSSQSRQTDDKTELCQQRSPSYGSYNKHYKNQNISLMFKSNPENTKEAKKLKEEKSVAKEKTQDETSCFSCLPCFRPK